MIRLPVSDASTYIGGANLVVRDALACLAWPLPIQQNS